MLFLQTLPIIAYPAIDPVLLEIGPLAIRWYALAYVAGLMLGWRYVIRLARRDAEVASRQDIDEFLVWAMLGIVIGGRLGSVLFYHPAYYLDHPLQILFIWQGGMAFHGGLLGIIAALVLFAHLRRLPLLGLADLIACAAPIGLFLGRLANFVNGELYGRTSQAPWAMVFPHAGAEPRHPSQLYEALLEGLVLFVLLWAMARRGGVRRRHGLLSGVFLCGYAIARVISEVFRAPDAHIGFLVGGITMGQLLSLPILVAGAYLIARARPALS